MKRARFKSGVETQEFAEAHGIPTELGSWIPTNWDALTCRDALGYGTREKLTLYFTESALRLSTTRTDEQLELVRADILARVARMRSGDFTATPGKQCTWCDFIAMCPERAS